MGSGGYGEAKTSKKMLPTGMREEVHLRSGSSLSTARSSARSNAGLVLATLMLGLAVRDQAEPWVIGLGVVAVLGFASMSDAAAGVSWLCRSGANAVTQVWRAVEKSVAYLLVFMLTQVVVRGIIGYLIVLAAVMVRSFCRLFRPSLFQTPKGARRRVLFVTDYMPPQVHGIAVRCENYVEHLRKEGDDVVVFTTAAPEGSKDKGCHATLPHIVNPYNEGNRLCYAPGIMLSWYLAMYKWDVVHIVYPSLLGMFILPICKLRGIPTYCSHHVDMSFYGPRYVHPLAAKVALGLYNALTLAPAQYLASANAAPTHVFLDNHMSKGWGGRYRVPSGVEKCMRLPKSTEEREIEREALLKRCGVREGVKMFLMVQRIAPEKNTELALKALGVLRARGENVHMAVAGNGPSLESVRKFAEEQKLPVTFLGAVKHQHLPCHYRAADVFVTCSLSETFGLTLAETLSCGTPAVMPEHCVFDELWADRVPTEWRFRSEGGADAVADAMMAAARGRDWLGEHPVNMTWADAASELSGQYQEIIDIEQARTRHDSLWHAWFSTEA